MTLSRTPLALLVAASLVGCEAPVESITVVPFASPAGEGSGEPFLSSAGDAVHLSWLERAEEGGHDLWVAALEDDGWGERRHVAYGDRFFVNWADFPSVGRTDDGRLWAHWLQRGPGGPGGYDYGVRVAWSDDEGASWSEPWTPHEDGTPTEHGFVTVFPVDDGVGVVWLDGRGYALPGEGGEPPREMSLRYRTMGPAGAGPEVLLDARTCDCCQTDAAVTAEGPVIVYRDRSEDEIRDIYITRGTPAGWTEGAVVHADGWQIGGCPVNGPAVVARDRTVAVAWFTAAADQPRVKVAWSEDAGATFGPPVQVDDGDPSGRVDLLMRDDGRVVVSWMERTGGEDAEVRMRLVERDGGVGSTHTIVATAAARGAGFPRLAALPGGDLLAAWTDVSDRDRPVVRTARIEMGGS